jgi:hypothetical protein
LALSNLFVLLAHTGASFAAAQVAVIEHHPLEAGLSQPLQHHRHGGSGKKWNKPVEIALVAPWSFWQSAALVAFTCTALYPARRLADNFRADIGVVVRLFGTRREG